MVSGVLTGRENKEVVWFLAVKTSSPALRVGSTRPARRVIVGRFSGIGPCGVPEPALERDSETIAPHTVNAIPISARIPARRMLFVGLILRERKR